MKRFLGANVDWGRGMELVEVRDLDGPNLFMLEPAIKLEVALARGEAVADSRRAEICDELGLVISSDPLETLTTLISELHRRVGLPAPPVSIHRLDHENNYAICFPWEWRTCAMRIAESAVGFLIDGLRTSAIEDLLNALAADQAENDRPTWVRDSERRIPTIAITGTNGKTTTTRLLAHIVREAGYSVGWSSSSGVYINGVQVIDGDYTGHGGARRVLLDPDVEVAVLETARGGILQRGLGYESNDVSVFLNVSADHLFLHGVTRIETLARAKATVVRTTRPGGIAVLNAEDPLVLAQKDSLRAEPVLISQNPDNAAVREHANGGGRSVVRDGRMVAFGDKGQWSRFMDVADIPLTYGGAARHMVENVLAACAASLGLGIGPAVLSDALRSFQPDVEHNAGRLNVFELDGRVVVVDFAHNESGLNALIDFARNLYGSESDLTVIIGTAGDRDDDVFLGLGRIAGQRADRIIIKRNPRYLRGRESDDMVELMIMGIRETGAENRLTGIYPNEFNATFSALEESRPGEVIVMMCVEDYLRIIEALRARGANEPATTPK